MERFIRYLLVILLVGLLIFAVINHDALFDRLFDFRDQIHAEKIDEHIVGSVSRNNDITLDADLLPEDTYTLWYENASGQLNQYAQICTLTVSNGNSPVYAGLIPENCAPIEARVIGVYNSRNERVGGILLGGLKKDLGSKLYTFGAISDVHIGFRTAEEDFAKALDFLVRDQWAEFVCVSGDLTRDCTDEELATYQKIVSEFEHNAAVYSIRGNHDSPQYRKDDVEGLFEMPLYYSFQRGEDVFIMLGIFDEKTNALFPLEEMQWLYETLEENKHRRCFIFQHVRPENTSGNAMGIYAVDIWGGSDQTVFEGLLEHYPNTILFHGHSHLEFSLQEIDDVANYDFSDGYHSVHVPSITIPRTGNSDGATSREELPDESEGYLVDVYESGIMLRGRDFVRDLYLPIAQYYLDTTLKAPSANHFSDKTCTVHWDSEGIPLDWSRDMKIDKSSGVPLSASGYSISQSIDIEAGYRYRLCSKNAVYLETVAFFYDADGKYIEFSTLWGINQANSNKKAMVQEIHCPEEAASMVLRLKYPEDTTARNIAEKSSYLSLTKWQ